MLVPSVADAYKTLKRIVYRENLDFVARSRVAEFESSGALEERLVELQNLVLLGQQESLVDSRRLDELLEEITFFLLPKKVLVSEESDADRGYLSNKRTSDSGYQVDEVSYFIDLPVELRVLDTLWVMTAGRLLDSRLPDTLYANRLNSGAEGQDATSMDLFKFYVSQYSKWRDTAIKTAVDLLEKHNSSAALFSFDIRQYYYNIRLDYDDLIRFLDAICQERCDPGQWLLIANLTHVLREMHSKYHSAVRECFQMTHCRVEQEEFHDRCCEITPCGLPVGLASSQVLANWYLREFDERVVRELSPSFYGRYVDDVIVVVQNPVVEAGPQARAKFVERYFKGLIQRVNSDFVLQVPDGLRVQEEKLLLHHYDKEHSQAGLRYFMKELERQNSAFRFMPGSDVDQEIDEIAYDLIREGSVNKLRSITGFHENSTELSKYLALQIIAHRLSDETRTNRGRIIDQLFKFFQGKNFLDFCRLWEKVFSFTIIENRFEDAYRFYRRAQLLFRQLRVSNDEQGVVLSILRMSLQRYLDVSLAVPCGLLDLSRESAIKARRFRELLHQEGRSGAPSIKDRAQQIRNANLIRHNYVSYPLINYTSYTGSLLTLDWDAIFRIAESSDAETWLNEISMQYTPRYIHLDELQLVHFLRFLPGPSLEGWPMLATSTIQSGGHPKSDMPVVSRLPSNGGADGCYRVSVQEPRKLGSLVVAIANMRVHEQDIVASYRRDKTANVSFGRQNTLYSILNAAEAEKADLLVFPEVSIPHCWLPIMVAYSRTHQIGLVFGLEHWVVGRRAYNLIVSTLPYRTPEGHNSCLVCIRTKNHYAPKEIADLKKVRLQPVETNPPVYHLISWRGVQFAPYNCFELADIRHRGLFRSELDLLVACVWNKDKPYYDNIMESAVRDLHCYVIEANTSAYGGSCVLKPTQSETMDIVRVKGGENACVLTATLDIEGLREFQYQEYSETDKAFKPTPPGFDHESVLRRGSSSQ